MGMSTLTRSASNSSASSQPFLTEVQRAALDAALATKQSTGTKSAQVSSVKSKVDCNHDRHVNRHARSKGDRGRVKKGGAGGKYTWGSILTNEDDVDGVIDRDDPIYNSEDDKQVFFESHKSIEIKQYKAEVMELLEEYLQSGDLAEAARSLQELEQPTYDHFFVKKALTLALDKHDREREMSSVLLSSLYSEVISSDQMSKGFLSLIDSLEDLKLDVPGVLDMAALFIARAVVDDVLPPAFVARMPAVAGSGAAEVRHKCEVHLGARHAAERLLRCWGSGAGSSYEETRNSLRSLLTEYVSSGDVAEAQRCLHRLSVPFFHHELVKQALHRALEEPSDSHAFMNLLQQLNKVGEVSDSQVFKGFRRVADKLEDTVLDNPGAREAFVALARQAQKDGWLDADFALPSVTPRAASANGASNSHSVHHFKLQAVDIVKEYLESADGVEVARRLAELEEPGMLHIFVKHGVQLAMERKDRERELVSNLLVSLAPQVLAEDQLEAGFTRLLLGVEDLVLDIPDAAHLLSLFLGRTIVDELLPPAFLTSVLPALRNDSLAVNVVRATGGMLAARHAAERLQNCWHGGAKTIEQLRGEMDALLAEYLTSGDEREASRCLMELEVPHYHHELVKRALLAAFTQEGQAHNIMGLLSALERSGEVTQTQMRHGFDRVERSLDDLSLDFPHAKTLYADMKAQALKEGWLTSD